MKQELFKDMYNKIQLNQEQKTRILNNLKTEVKRGYSGADRKFHTPAFAAACLCVIMVVSVPVLAANTSVMQSIVNAFGLLTEEKNLTDEQKNVYAKYGSALDIEIPMEDGTLKLDAVITDGYYICIPFSVSLKDKIETDGGKISASSLNKMLDKLSDFRFYWNTKEESFMGGHTILDENLREDGSITGAYLKYDDEKQFKKGDIIRIEKGEPKSPDENKETVSELIVDTPIETISVDTKKLNLPEGVSINKIFLSPISLRIEGAWRTGEANQSVNHSEITVELKDGSIIEDAKTGSHSNIGSINNNGYYPYEMTVLFRTPVNLDDVKKIHIKNGSLDLSVPAEKTAPHS